MGKTISKELKSLIAAALAAMPAKRRGPVGELAENMLSAVPADDLAKESPALIAEILMEGYDALNARASRNLSVKPLNDGRTAVVAMMANRAFIVDSMLAEVARQGLAIDLVIHPLIENGKRGLCSLVIIILEEMGAKQRKALKDEVQTVLLMVRQATDDWQDMLAEVGRTVVDFRTNPPPVPASDLAETIQFLEWLSDNNFTVLGMREYAYQGDKKTGTLDPVKGSALGILRNSDLMVMSRDGKPVVLTPEIRDFLFRPDPLIITKANLRSRVHRNTHLDYVGVKRYTPDGKLAGELRVVGLFTSTAYTKSVMTIPVLRHKVQAVLDEAQADPTSHTGKSLMNIVETWPRDEMFQTDIDRLSEFTKIAATLEERPQVRVLVRSDRFDRFVSLIVYVPRDRYDSEGRRQMGEYFAEVFEGHVSAFYPVFLESGLTRVHFIIGRHRGKTPRIPRGELEDRVREIVRTWSDRLREAAGGQLPGHDFSVSYQEQTLPEEAIRDIESMADLSGDGDPQIALDFHVPRHDCPECQTSLKLFHLDNAVPLSRRVPVLENLGFHVIEESTFELKRDDGRTVFLHDMLLETANGERVDNEQVEGPLKDTLHAVWDGLADNDSFNALVLVAGLDWQHAAVFRAYARYLRQIRTRFTTESMAETLIRHPQVARDLSRLFDERFVLNVKTRDAKMAETTTKITTALEKIESSDDDRIIRNFGNLVDATMRTNFYAPTLDREGPGDSPPPVLAFKIDPSQVKIMPKPVPYREIFVSSPQVEGTHLRFGPVARGGLRWSDRAQDYRTEVLGLVKAQQVKNAVIVPVGSKGGFVPRNLPVGGDRQAFFEAGRQAYRVYISSLLSITDNLVDGKIAKPAGVIRHDGDDPYFVVAADKGTATFSDTANAISQDYDYWLDDAFASGGSAGYDHKKMGITARGAWEAVKRHFREMEKDGRSWDIQSMPFTAAGVGDMSGDVFGNGMLLSEKTRLIAAFDHRDIFVDPDPDITASFKERKRLFDMGRSSWQDYDKKLISKGGGIFPRSAKSITLPKAAADAIGFDAGTHTPQEIMSAIMRAPVDLMWFGGIGTYIRATHESDADAGDRSNDAIRVTAKEVRAKVIGEGANLGVTQPGRIEYAMRGGCVNSDAIDNSAGVNSSDVEVNIKIALAAAMKSGKLSRTRRNTLLESMTETVADLVLRNNYLQTLSISLSQRRGMEAFVHQQRLMQSLEARELLDRAVEDLPDDAELVERQAAGKSLARPEIGVLLAYAKIVALDDLIVSDVPDDDYFKDMLFGYFPPKMQKTYRDEIEGHRLRREIVATVLANSMINRGGPTFVSRITDRTGATVAAIARAYVAVRDAFHLLDINNSIDALDTKISGDLQLELYHIVQERVLSQTVWFVRYADFSKGITPVADPHRKAVEQLTPKLEKILPDFLIERIEADSTRFREGGVPKDVALQMARLPLAGLIPDILFAAQATKASLDDAADVFFAVTAAFRIGRITQAARTVGTSDYYDNLALDRALQSLHKARRDITIEVLSGKGDTADWLSRNEDSVVRTLSQMRGIVENDQATVSRLTVAANLLGDLVRS